MTKYKDHPRVKCTAVNADNTPCRRWAMHGQHLCLGHYKLEGTGLSQPLPHIQLAKVIESSGIGQLPGSVAVGRYDRYAPPEMRANVVLLQKDPELLSQRPEIALLTAKIIQQVQDINAGLASKTWDNLRETAMKLRKYNSIGDRPAANEELKKLLEQIKQGSDEQQGWKDIFKTIKVKDDLIQSELSRIKASKEYLTTEEATLMIEKFVKAVQRSLAVHVSDRNEIMNVVQDLSSEVSRLARR